MTEKVLCPYCGSEMNCNDFVKTNGKYLAYTMCSNKACQSIGPTVTNYETMAEARAAALAAAQARYLPPNRPLTLDEVKALDADDVGDIPCFIEVEPTAYKKDPDDFEPRLRADVISKPSLAEPIYYNKCYRGWLRKPTQAEMDAAEWGDNTNENA